MYKLEKINSSGEQLGVIRLSDNAHIPFDEANTDYQEYLEYLEWVAEGNTPEPADTITDNGGNE